MGRKARLSLILAVACAALLVWWSAGRDAPLAPGPGAGRIVGRSIPAKGADLGAIVLHGERRPEGELRTRVDGQLGRQRRDWLVPGLESGLSQAFEPGVYELALETPGFERLERSIVLHAGGLSELNLPLAPASTKQLPERARFPVDRPRADR